jgi:hypothetical protein
MYNNLVLATLNFLGGSLQLALRIFKFAQELRETRFPAAAPTLADFLNWMPSTETQDDGVAEDIQESAEAALAATSQGI